jgi:hypothetical protein
MTPVAYGLRHKNSGKLIRYISESASEMQTMQRMRELLPDTNMRVEADLIVLYEAPPSPITPWFPPEVKPVRVGHYPVDYGVDGISFAHWNGVQWCEWEDGSIISNQNLRWYGLTSEVK